MREAGLKELILIFPATSLLHFTSQAHLLPCQLFDFFLLLQNSLEMPKRLGTHTIPQSLFSDNVFCVSKPEGNTAGSCECEPQLTATGTCFRGSKENLTKRDNNRMLKHGLGQMSCERKQSSEFVLWCLGWTCVPSAC